MTLRRTYPLTGAPREDRQAVRSGDGEPSTGVAETEGSELLGFFDDLRGPLAIDHDASISRRYPPSTEVLRKCTARHQPCDAYRLALQRADAFSHAGIRVQVRPVVAVIPGDTLSAVAFEDTCTRVADDQREAVVRREAHVGQTADGSRPDPLPLRTHRCRLAPVIRVAAVPRCPLGSPASLSTLTSRDARWSRVERAGAPPRFGCRAFLRGCRCRTQVGCRAELAPRLQTADVRPGATRTGRN